MTNEEFEEIKKKIEEAKVSLKSYVDLYDNVFCVSHHHDFVKFKLNPNDGDHEIVENLYRIKTNLLHESTKVFHNLYQWMFHGDEKPVTHVNAFNHIFHELILVVTQCNRMLWSADNDYVMRDPFLLINWDKIAEDYNLEKDWDNIPVEEIFNDISECYSDLYNLYHKGYRTTYQKVLKIVERKYGFMEDVHNFYKFVFNQINRLADAIFTEAYNLFHHEIDVLVYEPSRPWLIVKLLNLRCLYRSMKSMSECLNIGYISDEDMKWVETHDKALFEQKLKKNNVVKIPIPTQVQLG